MTRRGGFTLVELLLVAVLGTLVASALYRAHLQQQRFALWEGRVVQDHDAFRVASSILATDLREVVAADGDLELPTEDSLSVRAPLGFAVVCSVRANPATIGLARSEGRMWESVADSLWVFTTPGWRVLSPSGELSAVPRPLECPFGISRPDHLYSLPRHAADSIPVGAPVRIFRRHTYHVATNAGELWLARTDAAGTEMLVGPVEPGGVRFRMVDDAGNATAAAADATGVELRLLLPLTPVPGSRDATSDTLTLVFQSRNR